MIANATPSRACPWKGRSRAFPMPDFNKAPLLVIWEVTRACALACRHCRASAEDRRDPRELSTEQGFRLIDEVAEMGTPLIVFTGGDPLQRDDLELLVRHAGSRNLRVGTIPATTPRLTRERLESLKAAGVDQMAFSLDGSNATLHDNFRRVPGSYAKAIQGATWVRELDIPLQINTVFGDWNVDEFDAMAALVESLDIVFWEVFFLVPTGRGSIMQPCSAEQMELLFEKLYRMMLRVPFTIKVTEGQHFRAYVARQLEQDKHLTEQERERLKRFIGRPPVNAGRGFCFVDHTGQICPSGFLPELCGDVRTTSITSVYREHPLFLQLRDASQLQGPCHTCTYRELCSGGSRARAHAVHGHPMAPEPFCSLYRAAAHEVA